MQLGAAQLESPDKPAFLADRLNLEHHHRVFSIEFAAPSARQPQQTRFAYRLEPFDQEWLYTDADRRVATYTNLPPDTYQFKVKALENQYAWSPPNQRLFIHIKPPFWQTRTAMTLYVLFIVFCIWGYSRYQRRLRRILEEQVAIRTEQLISAQQEAIESAHAAGMSDLAEDMLHQLGNRFNSIKTATQILREQIQKDQAQYMMERLIKALKTQPEMGRVQLYLEKVNDILKRQFKELDNESSSLDERIQTISAELLHHQKYFRKSELELIDLDALVRFAGNKQHALFHRKVFKIHFPPQRKIGVWCHPTRLSLALSSIFQNAIEAAQPIGGNIRIEFEDDDEFVTVSLSDDGEGIPAEHSEAVWQDGFTTRPGHPGRGLHYCGNVIKEMQGEINLFSAGSGKGATVTIRLRGEKGPQKHKQIVPDT